MSILTVFIFQIVLPSAERKGRRSVKYITEHINLPEEVYKVVDSLFSPMIFFIKSLLVSKFPDTVVKRLSNSSNLSFH